MGLVSRVVPDAELDATAAKMADQLARTPSSALHATKRLFYSLDAKSFDEGLALGVVTNVEARSTEDFREGVRRFVRRDR